jgi:hypothetical protein
MDGRVDDAFIFTSFPKMKGGPAGLCLPNRLFPENPKESFLSRFRLRSRGRVLG